MGVACCSEYQYNIFPTRCDAGSLKDLGYAVSTGAGKERFRGVASDVVNGLIIVFSVRGDVLYAGLGVKVPKPQRSVVTWW